jgi:hypothetical protein
VGTFPVDPVKGKKIRFSGFIKTAGVEDGYAGLWWRADDPSGSVAFDNMQSRAIKGDTDWTSYAIELEIPETTVNVNFGALLVGRGQAWFDGLKVEIDGKEFDVSGVFDAGFEESAPRGFTTGGDGYAVAIDGGTAKLGKQSLRMASTGEKVEKPKEQALDLAAVSKSCGEIVSRLEARRDAYLKTSSPREVDWAIQNARVVHQCLQSETKEVSRDASMARNVKWILDHAPEGSKVVLWSHNGHAGRLVRGGEWSGMGSFLDVWYGKAQVIVGFAAGEGTYTAIVSGKGLRSDNRLQPPAKDSYEAYFRAASLPRFLLDLRKARPDDPASAWLTRAHDFRSIGALAMGEQFASTDLRGLYDGIIYLDQTTASRTLKPGDGPR